MRRAEKTVKNGTKSADVSFEPGESCRTSPIASLHPILPFGFPSGAIGEIMTPLGLRTWSTSGLSAATLPIPNALGEDRRGDVLSNWLSLLIAGFVGVATFLLLRDGAFPSAIGEVDEAMRSDLLLALFAGMISLLIFAAMFVLRVARQQRQRGHEIQKIVGELQRFLSPGHLTLRFDNLKSDDLSGIFGALRVLTDRTIAHVRALEFAHAQLEARVDERTRDLELALSRFEVTAKYLSDRESLLRSVLDTAADGVIVCDRSAQVQSFNRAAAELFGRDVLAQKECSLASILELRSSVEKSSFDVDIDFSDLTRLFTPSRWRLLGRRASGEVFAIDAAVSEVFANDQIYFTWIFRDITDFVEAENQRRDAAEARARAERAAGIAETAAGVLHNVGNVLTSVTTSVMVLREQIESPVHKTLAKLVEFMAQHVDENGDFIATDTRGRAVPGILSRICQHLDSERESWRGEFARLLQNVEHVAQVISSHQGSAREGRGGLFRKVALGDLIEDVLSARRGELGHEWLHQVWEIRRDFEAEIDEHKVLQILVNLVKNATESVAQAGPARPKVVLRLGLAANNDLIIAVEDNGIGIAGDQVAKIFSHGFTTKAGGNGFGLHNSANAAVEMGGSLQAESAGLGQGATFILQVPSRRAKSNLGLPRAKNDGSSTAA
jgi:PAS domain S-box-containing protein